MEVTVADSVDFDRPATAVRGRGMGSGSEAWRDLEAGTSSRLGWPGGESPGNPAHDTAIAR